MRIKFFKAGLVGIFFGLLTASHAGAQSIVGAWTGGVSTREGAFVVIFFANGFFVQIDNVTPLDAPGAFDGFERGTYSWDPATGAFISATIQDLNGDAGYSSLNGLTDVTATISGETLKTVVPGRGSFSLTRVTGASPIVGAWGSIIAAPDNSTAFVFLPNGVYFMARDGDANADPSGRDGIEHGTYSWNPATGALTSSAAMPPYVDTNGNGASLDRRRRANEISGDLLTHLFGRRVERLRARGPAATTAINYQGLWWNAPAGSESGWGISLAHQGDVIFARGSPMMGWEGVVAVDDREQDGKRCHAGDLSDPRSAFNAVPFTPARHRDQGRHRNADLQRRERRHVRLRRQRNRADQADHARSVRALPSCTVAPADLTAAVNYQDLWWAPRVESGWGVNFTQQGDIIFATWFTYDLDGTPMWLSATATKSGPGVYAGTLYRTTGPPFNAVPFLPANVTAISVGTLTLTFANGNSGTFAYTVNGVAQSKAIVRQLFSATGTVCL
jgi:hypothetical protein